MQIPKQIKLRTVVFLLACMLFVSSVSIYYGLSASTPTSGLTDIYIEPPMMEASYIVGIYTSPSTCYYKNGTTGEIVGTGSFYYCLQNAITALTTGGKVKVRGGDYTLTSQIVIAANNIFVEGEEGMSTSIQWNTTSAAFVFGSGSWHYFCGLKNLIIHGSAIAAIDGIYIQGPFSDVWIDNCYISSMNTGITLKCGVTAGDKIWNVWIQNCLIEDNLKYGIYLTTTYDGTTRMIDRVKISECHFYGNKNSVHCDTPYVWHVTFTDNTVQAETQSCVNVTSGGRQWIISDNHIFDCGIGANGTYAGIFVNGTATFYPDSWLIENNIIANHFTSAPVAMNNSIWLTGTVTNFVIQGNFFFQASEPIRIDGLTSYSSIKVNGNADYANNLVFPSENRPYSYLIGAFKSSYYMLNCSTGNVDYQSTNFTKVWNFAGANVTSSGGTVFVGKGSYTQAGILFLYSNVHYLGEGYGTKINLYAGVAWYGCLINSNGAVANPTTLDSNITVEGMRFMGLGAGQTSKAYGIHLHNAVNCRITRCYIENMTSGSGNWAIQLDGNGAAVTTNNNRVDHNYISNIDYDGVQIKADLGSVIGETAINNIVEDNYITNCQCGVTTYNANRNKIQNNILVDNAGVVSGNNGAGIFTHGSLYCEIVGNRISGSRIGIGYINLGGINDGYHVISGNFIIAIEVDSIGYALTMGQYNTVTDNTVLFQGDYNQHGVTVDGLGNILKGNKIIANVSYYDPMISVGGNANNTIISNNYIYSNAADPRSYCILVQGADYVSIQGNYLDGRNGVDLDSGSTYTVVEGNIFSSTLITKVTDDGTSSAIRWNQNYKTEASGALASCVNGTAIPHGMVTTPAVLTLCLHGPTAYNATMILCAPTILSVNATHMVIEFVMWETVTWTLVPVTAVEAQTVWWTAQTWNYP